MPDSSAGLNAVPPPRAGVDEGARSVRDSAPLFDDDFRVRLRWAWRVIWHGKALIAACVLLVLVPTVLYLKQVPPRYTAYASIMVEAPETRDPLSDRVMRPWMSDAVVQTEAALITSTLLARRVVEKLNLENDPEFNAALREPRPVEQVMKWFRPSFWLGLLAGPPEADTPPLDEEAKAERVRMQVVRRFMGGLEVTVPRRTFIIAISYTSEDREKAALIANTVADMYVLDRLEAGFEEARRVASWLGERLETLQHDVVAAEGAVEEYRALHGLRRRGERQITLTDQQSSELSSRLVVARSELAQKRARLEQIRNLLRSRSTLETATDVLQSGLIQRLREQEAELQRDMSDARKVYGDRHPRLVSLRAELDEIRSKIASEIEKIVASVANDVQIAAAGVQTLEHELNNVRQEGNVAAEAEVRLRELERQADASRNLYEAFLNRYKREVETGRMQRANARIVSPAEPPGGKSYPNEFLILVLMGAGAFFGGIALVFLLDRLDNSIRSSDEAEELTGLPVLGIVPLQRGRPASPTDELVAKPRSALADSIRSIRTSIDQGSPGSAPVVMVTSSMPKEGKTFVSLCLAFMFSRSEGRVLLIDADVHRPRLHSALGISGEHGLAQVLTGESTFDEAVRTGVAGSLDLLPSGKVSNTVDLIRSGGFASFLNDVRSRYDRIVIDTAPVLAVSDTRVIAPLVSRVIYLVHWNSTSRDAVRNGIKLLDSVGVQPAGIVLSQLDQRKHSRYAYGDYGRYYGRYREYYSE